MRIRTTAMLFGAVLSAAPVLHAQSLADLARHESERRKSTAKGGDGKVYTNKDLKPVIAPAPVEPSAPGRTPDTASSDAKAAGTATTETKTEVKDEAWWRKRGRELASKLEEDRILADALQSRVNALTMDFVNRDNPVERSRIETDRQRALVELDRLNKALVTDQKALKDFEEEARTAGVTPGWLR